MRGKHESGLDQGKLTFEAPVPGSLSVGGSVEENAEQ